MLFSGVWYLCDDGIVRPIIRGEILAGDGSWRAAEFLSIVIRPELGGPRYIAQAGD